MARNKEFDPDDALDAAMRLFWRHGYEATSTADLVRELGIARASLYATFGSKRELYLAVLDRFLDDGAGGRSLQKLRAPGSPMSTIRDFLLTSAAAEDPAAPSGCLAVNATVEHAGSDPEITRRLDANRRRVEDALAEALSRARFAGEIDDDLDLPVTATLLATLNTGLKVLARAGSTERERMAATIDNLLDTLAPRPSRAA